MVNERERMDCGQEWKETKRGTMEEKRGEKTWKIQITEGEWGRRDIGEGREKTKRSAWKGLTNVFRSHVDGRRRRDGEDCDLEEEEDNRKKK